MKCPGLYCYGKDCTCSLVSIVTVLAFALLVVFYVTAPKMTLLFDRKHVSRIQKWWSPFSLRTRTMQHGYPHYSGLLSCFFMFRSRSRNRCGRKSRALVVSFRFVCSAVKLNRLVRKPKSTTLKRWLPKPAFVCVKRKGVWLFQDSKLL